MEISNIGGRWKLSNGVKIPYLGLGVYKAKDGNEVKNAVKVALDAGYRLIDTATFYHNEEGVGEAIRESGIPREEIFVTTKLWIDDQLNDNTENAFYKSLDRLKLDYIDLYLIHWPVPEKYLESWKVIQKIYDSGKVKAIGVSNCLEHHLESLKALGGISPMLVQNEFHPRLVQKDLIEYCHKNDIIYQAWSPLMRAEILSNQTIQKIAKKHQKTPAQVVIRWDLQMGVATIPKSVHKKRIEENARVFDFELSKDEMELITSLDKEERTGAHPDKFMRHFGE
ncbi:aldo/keto reductase [Christiangramia fulva]|uniref:Aldo/keto reductase n=1 Tax=Christiangramia fulva TaxID=2126553 RepID=A0A2R3Z6P8_9FLAO|nr:aldo/keto reductase [Christiangramia fulva]AVR45967.1 aldo/keto reductase [Christiangramia fulva]